MLYMEFPPARSIGDLIKDKNIVLRGAEATPFEDDDEEDEV